MTEVHPWSPANAITALRAALTVVLAVLVVRDTGPALVTVLAAVALATDAIDGRVARRTGTVTAFGARFELCQDRGPSP